MKVPAFSFLNLIFLILLLALGAVGTQAQPLDEQQKTAFELRTEQFDKWVKSEANELYNRQLRLDRQGVNVNLREDLRPLTLENAVFLRLQADLNVADSSVLETVDAWVRYEGPKENSEYYVDAKGQRFPNTRRVINSLRAHLYDRSDLDSQLLEKLARATPEKDQCTQEISEYQETLTQIDQIKYKLDKRRQYLLIELGKKTFESGDKEGAIALYQQAASYPWFQMPGTEFRDLYALALTCWINARRGNRQALLKISFYPAVRDQVQPLLDSLLAEVGGK